MNRAYIRIEITCQLKQSEVRMHDSRLADESRYVIRLRGTYSRKSLRFYRFAALGAHLHARNHLETNIPSNKLTMYVDRNPRALIILSL